MLQQTQASTAATYFERFLEEFPNVYSLARASQKKVLELWAGLGYYGRARNLHKAAKRIIKMHGGFPEKYEDIVALPGVGRYTAGAICSLAFNHAQPVVDGNIRRVLIRLNAIKGHVSESYYWHQMSVLLSKKNPSSFNQAMMELGAIVCLPARPLCPACPVKSFCNALESGIQCIIPKAPSKRPRENLRMVTLVLEQNGRICLASTGKPEIIPGKWGLPCMLLSSRDSAEEAGATLCRKVLGRAVPLMPSTQIRHSITNYRISVFAFYAKVDFTVSPHAPRSCYWATRSFCRKSLTSSLFHKVINAADAWNKGEKGQE